jgi:hypothetical protein
VKVSKVIVDGDMAAWQLGFTGILMQQLWLVPAAQASPA